MFFAAPFFFWFIGLQLKQFALHKCYDKTLWIFKSLSLFCLYSTKRARNTRRSTALGKKPLLFGIVPDTQNHPIPLWIQFLLGVAVARREEVCIVMYPVSLWSTRLLHAQFNSCFLPLCWVFPTVSRELVAWRESKFWKGGVRFFFFFFEVPKSFFVAISNNQKQKKSKNKKENPAPVDIEYGRKKDLWCILHNVTVTWRWNCVLLLFPQKNWLTIQTAGLHNKSDNRKFDKAPVNDWVPCWRWPEGSGLADVND